MKSMNSGVHAVRCILILITIAVGVGCLSVLMVGQITDATNVTSNITSTVSGIKNNTAAGNTTTNSNVTAASGNNGHIYRGGAAAGSGGE